MYSPLQIIILSSVLVLLKFGNGSAQEVPKGPIDFAKLELNKNALLGSRWALEHKEPITVYHSCQIVDMVKVDLNDMSIRVDFFMRQRWNATDIVLPEGLFLTGDPEGTFISTEEAVLKSTWSPDSFIPNARDAKIMALTTTESAVNIYPNKTITYKMRMYAALGCSFTFQWYPLDIQVCDLVFESYKYATNDAIYVWEEDDPVTALPGIILYQYDFFLPPMISNSSSTRWGVEYPNVKMTFKFERKLGNNLIQVYTPTILVVILSFFSFWLGLDAVPGRISLLITCILTLVTMHSGLKGVVPPVHYVNMMDIWMIGCMVFVFGAICEFIVVKYLKWRDMQNQAAKEEREAFLKKHGLSDQALFRAKEQQKMMTMPNTIYPDFVHYNKSINNVAQKRQAWTNHQAQAMGIPPDYDIQHHGLPAGYPGIVNMNAMQMYNHPHVMPPQPPPASRKIWVKIDRVCRLLFPLLFAVFNATYWPMLLIGSAKQHLDVTGSI